MCGITGFIDLQRQMPAAVLTEIAENMTASLLHRGPDDSGVWVDESAGIALGHRRLSIIDLSPQGHQPMISGHGRFVLVFNGEIYNFKMLQNELAQKGFKFQGKSDTEVMLASFVQWGIIGSLRRFNGMFAFALWDQAERKLFIGRDRMGEKPLYYGLNNHFFFFSSELKAICKHPYFSPDIDRNALALYLRYNYIPAPFSIYKGICKLPPGTFAELTLGRLRYGQVAEPMLYWSLREIAEQGTKNPFQGSELEAVDALEELLREAVKEQMVADVPLGVFLSGGLDSSMIVAIMRAQSHNSVKTFTIGFHEKEFNEAIFARGVAEYLGTDHTELYVTPGESMAVISKLPSLYDEPFADSSQIPTFLIAELAKFQVTVALSGDGGDELFGGYGRYVGMEEIWNKIGAIPLFLRKNLAKHFKNKSWAWVWGILEALIPEKMGIRRYGQKFQTLMQFLDMSPDEFYCWVLSSWKQPSSVVIDSQEPLTALSNPKQWPELPSFLHQMMYFDMKSYLPDDILVKVDRAAMGVSLETRVPMLDHRVVEFSWKLPLSLKVRNGKGKWILRQLLDRYLPRQLVERSKMGFELPIGQWLRGPLREWAENLLDEEHLRLEGFFNPAPIRQNWQEHLSGNRDWESCLWGILMFEAWLETQK